MNEINIAGSFLIGLEPYNDNRGSFTKILNSAEISQRLGFDYSSRQVMVSRNRKKGTLRGMHLQGYPINETKVLYCFEGKVLDVIIDLRPKSLTYMQVNSFLLDADKPSVLIVPEQCAHGFITLEDDSGLIYSSNVDYDKTSDIGVNPLSSSLRDIWPTKIEEISERDLNLPKLEELPWLEYY